MNDSSDSKLDALFARARARARVPGTSRAEYGFETRLAARLREAQTPAPAWGAVSWRLIPVFALVVLGLAAWQVAAGSASEEAAQISAVENPEAADMLASFN